MTMHRYSRQPIGDTQKTTNKSIRRGETTGVAEGNQMPAFYKAGEAIGLIVRLSGARGAIQSLGCQTSRPSIKTSDARPKQSNNLIQSQSHLNRSRNRPGRSFACVSRLPFQYVLMLCYSAVTSFCVTRNEWNNIGAP